jgi:hypothetical protein
MIIISFIGIGIAAILPKGRDIVVAVIRIVYRAMNIRFKRTVQQKIIHYSKVALAIGIVEINQPITIIIYTIVANLLCHTCIIRHKKKEQ